VRSSSSGNGWRGHIQQHSAHAEQSADRGFSDASRSGRTPSVRPRCIGDRLDFRAADCASGPRDRRRYSATSTAASIQPKALAHSTSREVQERRDETHHLDRVLRLERDPRQACGGAAPPAGGRKNEVNHRPAQAEQEPIAPVRFAMARCARSGFPARFPGDHRLDGKLGAASAATRGSPARGLAK